MFAINNKTTEYGELISKANCSNFLQTFSSIMLAVAAAFFISHYAG
jgi:hypothetical protein